MNPPYNTGNPLGSFDTRDRADNSRYLDLNVNGPEDAYPDRFGVMRQSLQGIRNASQYVDLGPYAAALVFTSRNQVFSYLGNFYAPGPAITLPYTTTGAGAGEIANFRNVGDALLRTELTGADGAELVGRGDSTVDADLTAIELLLAGTNSVTPQQFGAIGNGIADDSDAVLAAITDGRPVDWGTATYRITEEIDEEITHRIYWVAAGARIFYDAPAPTQNVIKLKVSPHTHAIKGVLLIDANRKAFNGIWLLSASDTVDTATAPLSYPNLIADDLQVTRAYRASTAFTGGNGILVEGAWNKVGFLRPVITDCRMAVGAQVTGEQGIFGLSVMRIGSSSLITPFEITVIDPCIDGITSEDDTYQFDQDGMRLFTSYNQGVVRGTEFSWSVIGGVIRNCRNREIKGQSNGGRVIGTKLVRTTEVGGGVTGASPSIDQQIGPVTITNLEFFFRDHAPLSISSDRTRIEDYVQAGTQLSGIKGLLSGAAFMTYFFFAGVEGGAPNRHRVAISDVDVQHQGSARIGYFFQVETSNVTGAVQGGPKPSRIMLSNISCMVRDAWINAVQVGGGHYTVDMVNNHNTYGADIPILTDTAPTATRTVSAINSTGFVTPTRLQGSSGQTGNETRIAAIAPVGVERAGLTRPVAFTLESGASYTIPFSAMSNTISNVLILAVSRATAGGQAMFFCGSAEITIASAGSTDWVSGGASEPASGTYRIWASAGGITVKNMQGTTRTFSGLLIG